jgi:hypothetical protein
MYSVALKAAKLRFLTPFDHSWESRAELIRNFQTVSRETVWKLSTSLTEDLTNCCNGAQSACSWQYCATKTHAPEATERLSRQSL